MSYMQTPSSTTQAKGLIITQTVPVGALNLLLSPWEMLGNKQPVLSTSLNIYLAQGNLPGLASAPMLMLP